MTSLEQREHRVRIIYSLIPSLFLDLTPSDELVLSFSLGTRVFQGAESPSSPFLHLAVGVAAVVDEASLVAHAVAVDDHATVQVQAVMVTVVVVLLNHPVPVEQHRDSLVSLLVPSSTQ